MRIAILFTIILLAEIVYAQEPFPPEAIDQPTFEPPSPEQPFVLDENMTIPRYYLWMPKILEACKSYEGLFIARDMQPFDRKVVLLADKPVIMFDREIEPITYTLEAYKNHLIFQFRTLCNIQTDVQFKAVIDDTVLIVNSTINTINNQEGQRRLRIVLPDKIDYNTSITGFVMLEDGLGNIIIPKEDITIYLRASDSSISIPPTITLEKNHYFAPFKLEFNAYRVYQLLNATEQTNSTNTKLEKSNNTITIYATAKNILATSKNIDVINIRDNLKMNIALLPKYIAKNDYGYIIAYITDENNNLYIPNENIDVYFAITNYNYATIIESQVKSYIDRSNPYAIARIESKNRDGSVLVGVASIAGSASATLHIGASIDSASMNLFVEREDGNSTSFVLDFKDDIVMQEVTFDEELAFMLEVRRNDIYHYSINAFDDTNSRSIGVELTPIESSKILIDTVNATRYGIPFMTAVYKVNEGRASASDKVFSFIDRNDVSYTITISDIELTSINPLELSNIELKNPNYLGITASVKNSIRLMSFSKTAIFREIILFEKVEDAIVKIVAPSYEQDVKINYVIEKGKEIVAERVGRAYFIYFKEDDIVTKADNLEFLEGRLYEYNNVYLAYKDEVINLVSDYAIKNDYLFKVIKNIDNRELFLDVPEFVHINEPFPFVAYYQDGKVASIKDVIANMQYDKYLIADDKGVNSITVVARDGVASKSVNVFLADLIVDIDDHELVFPKFKNGDTFTITITRPSISFINIDSDIIYTVDSIRSNNIITDRITFYPELVCSSCKIKFDIIADNAKPIHFEYTISVDEFRTLSVKAFNRLDQELNVTVSIERRGVSEEVIAPTELERGKEFATPFNVTMQVYEDQRQNEIELELANNHQALSLLDIIVNGKKQKANNTMSIMFDRDYEITLIYGKSISITLLPFDKTKGSGTYEYGTTIRVEADEREEVIPYLVYKEFKGWSDGNKDRIRTFVAEQDLTLEAKYEYNYSYLLLIIAVAISIFFVRKMIISYRERRGEELLSRF